MQPNSRAHNRDVMRRKALRKRRICRDVYHWEWYNNLHQYSKNKIHCSCPACQSRTKRRNKRFDWGPGRYNFKISELKRQVSMDYDEAEYNENI